MDKDKTRDYIQEIAETYKSSEGKRKDLISNRIERLARLLCFDYKKAKELREQANLSLEELAKKVGLSSPTTILGYESGKHIPEYSRSRGYVIWLKQKGYNPFEL